MNKCWSCGTENRVGVLVCENCQAALFIEPQQKPVDIPCVLSVKHNHAILKIYERRLFVERDSFVNQQVIVGRPNAETQSLTFVGVNHPRITEAGLSRQHIALEGMESGVHVRDLNSLNGTYLNASRLIPHTAYLLKTGDILHLGKMPFYIKLIDTTSALFQHDTTQNLNNLRA